MANDTGLEGQDALRNELARRTNTRAQDWFLVFKARLGMDAVFSTIRSSEGVGAVATIPFTCCTALDPIVTAGLSISWCDIDAKTLSLDPATLLAGDKGLRAAVIQHTLGLINPQTTQVIRELRKRVPLVVEDSAHCAGRMAKDPAGEPLADVSIHSFGTEKMIQGSYHGGAVWVNPDMGNHELRDALRATFEALPPLQGSLARKAHAYPLGIRVLNHLPSGVAPRVRSVMMRLGIFEPGIVDIERRAGLPYPPQQADAWVVSRALGGFARLDALERRCREAVATYEEQVRAKGAEALVPDVALDDPQPLLRFPVVLPSEHAAQQALEAANAAGFYTVPWYRPLLYPGPLDAGAYGWDDHDESCCPVARRVSAGIVALPCDLSPQDAARALDTVLAFA